MKQGKQISQLVRTMVEELDRYQGTPRTRQHYTRFRAAKRELYGMRPDLAPRILRFVVRQTHWGAK